ncbi:MAG: peptidylprolyl isomerase [Ignavibacteriaceae bacterium]|nr:peptidylprolyl isomerase [Ignavibacteriaceae bacterium]
MRLQFRFFLFSLFLFYTAPSFCQYNKSDEALVKTTFTREFDNKIISSYLNSNDERKIQTALLSISHSEDSSFIPQICSLDFQKYYGIICFTLGQLGEQRSSTQYLWQMFEKHQVKEIQKLVLETIGKTGNNNDLQKFLYLNEQKKIISNCGFALAIYNFSLRKISEKESISFLNEILAAGKEGCEETLFTLYRMGTTDSLILSSIEKIIRTEIKKEIPSQFVIQYALGIFRKAKYFPNDFGLLYKLSANSNPIIRIEIARTSIYFPFTVLTNFDFLLQLLLDKNSNVSRQMAISFREIQLNEKFKADALQFIRNQLKNKNLSEATRGELFIAFIKHLQTLDTYFIKEYEPFIDKAFVYQSCGELAILPNDIFNYLIGKYALEKKENKLFILSSLLKHQKNYGGSKSFSDFAFKVLAEKDISLSTTLLDELSDDFISKNKKKLVETILADTKRNKNDLNFAGSLESYYKVTEKIGKISANKFCKILASSNIHSIAKFASVKLGNKVPNQHNMKYFARLWERAFKYEGAIVKTTKGNFTIQFLPDAAPISVGNFCLLAEKNFFNGLKFHRVVPAFVIQGGDPENTGWGGSDIPIVSEFSPYQFQTGIVGMASSGKDTESSQWFVMQAFHPHLNGRYTIFGNVVEGLETVLQTEQQDKILSVELLH